MCKSTGRTPLLQLAEAEFTGSESANFWEVNEIPQVNSNEKKNTTKAAAKERKQAPSDGAPSEEVTPVSARP